jgi:hypothetical protein
MLAKDSGDHKLVGSVTTCLAALKNGERQFKFGNKAGPSLTKFECKQVVNFLEYIFGGCDINLHVAIDFTASNG